jgi:hypothetical protein
MKKILLIVVFTMVSVAVVDAQNELNCDADEHRQMDFWIGQWDVKDQTTGKQVGASRIEKRLNGCIIFESWLGEDQFFGHSFNMYNRETKKWQQVWVDSRGQRIDFTGEFRQNGMYYEGLFRSQDKEVFARMTFLKLPNDQVRQLWEQSVDGKTWKVEFDGLYTKTR